MRTVIALALCVCAGAAAFAGHRLNAPALADARHDGVSAPSDQRQLSFAVRGRIGATHVQAGAQVEQGQLLVELETGVQSRVVEAAQSRAKDTTEIKAAEKTLELRRVDYEKMQDAHQQGSASDTDLRTRRLQRDLAQIELDSANRRHEEAQVVLLRELARLEEMRIVSPVAGEVISLNRRGGESVDELTGVVALVVTDPLWIEVSVPSDLARRLSLGDPAAIRWADLAGQSESRGEVLFISPVSDPGSRKTLVRLVAPNPDGLPAGLHASIRFHGEDEVSRVYPSDRPIDAQARSGSGPRAGRTAPRGADG